MTASDTGPRHSTGRRARRVQPVRTVRLHLGQPDDIRVYADEYAGTIIVSTVDEDIAELWSVTALDWLMSPTLSVDDWRLERDSTHPVYIRTIDRGKDVVDVYAYPRRRWFTRLAWVSNVKLVPPTGGV